MPQIFVKPAIAGSVVRNPLNVRHVLAQEGEWIEPNTFWERKLIHGDIVLAEPPVQNTKPVTKSKGE